MNKADFVITISNSTTGKFLQNMTGTTDFQVVSPIVRLQEYGNYIIFVALVVSIAALVSNMIISMKGQHLSKTQITELKIQNVLLKEQNEQLRKQAENQDKLTKRQLNTTTLFKVFELLSSPDIRRARTEMYNEYWKLVDRKKEVNCKKILFICSHWRKACFKRIQNNKALLVKSQCSKRTQPHRRRSRVSWQREF